MLCSAQTKSCIVQKIMEKLLDYERETSSLGSPSDSGLPTAKSLPPNGKVGTGAASPGTNRFSNAARNVLTKIKCVPPSSELCLFGCFRGLFTERQSIREANHETNEWTHEDDANEEIDSNEDLANENLDKAVSELNDFPVFALETGESHQFAPVEKNLNESGSGGVKASLKRAQFRSLDEFSLKFTRSLLNDWKNPLKRVFQRIHCEVSDAGSHDSVDSFLEARKADPETILLNLGFGGSISNSSYSDTGRIPQRFLQPSKLNGIAIENFLKHQQLLVHSYESGLGGYRGLTGEFILIN
ncbi:uncharacterized protein LOC103511716 [Diaphorina citri]|uniref:Uncharacterized protein LOC103511716 n=1 Tax=Diaphorina citri TaxID=121845 RepID=A0A1S3D584_DIACI|nr:uncharacterized protein LOC103511716 [Diaphorina citri]